MSCVLCGAVKGLQLIRIRIAGLTRPHRFCDDCRETPMVQGLIAATPES